MVLTFTCTLSVERAGRQEVRTMLIAAIGCNLAWGIIDAVMYMVGCYVERGRALSTMRSLRNATSTETAHGIIVSALPPVLAPLLTHGDLESLRAKLHELPEPAPYPRIYKSDFGGGASVFFAVFLSTFPVVIPFFFIHKVMLALRISNGIAIAALFLTGYAFGHNAGYRPWHMGVGIAIVGVVLVAITIQLGG